MTAEPPRQQIIVVGGTGFYGRHLVDDLLEWTEAHIVVASRRPQRAPRRWRARSASAPRVTVLAADHRDVAALTRLVAPAAAVVHCAGPFQAIAGRGGHPLGPLRAALAAGVPYLDLSEDRDFRRAVLDLAGDAPTPVLTGASVVPGMQAILGAELARDLDTVVAVRCAAAPDTRQHRGDAMFRAMLHGAGRAFLATRDGVASRVYGWSEPEWVLFPPPLGRRLVYQVYEMADLDQMVDLFGATTVSFKAGSEFAWLNRALAMMAAIRARSGRPRQPERFTGAVRALSWLAGRAGNEAGGWFMELTGQREGRRTQRALAMTASVAGGRIPALLAAIAVEEILAGRVRGRGVSAAHQWFDPQRFWSGLDRRGVLVWQRTDDSPWQPRNL